MKENSQYISQVKVTKLWGRLDFDWSNINDEYNCWYQRFLQDHKICIGF